MSQVQSAASVRRMTSAEEHASLEGRVLAIAGAGGSLGPTVVRRLAPTGARLALAGREAGPLEALASDVGADADVTSVDLLDAAAARAWADGIAKRLGRVDGLLHLVGGWRGGTPIEESPREDWDFLAGLLIDTLQNVTQAFTPHLLASGRGRFAIVSAAQAQAPTNTNAAYAAAKAAAEAWTLALAHRFVGTGATANIVVVGSIVVSVLDSVVASVLVDGDDDALLPDAGPTPVVSSPVVEPSSLATPSSPHASPPTSSPTTHHRATYAMRPRVYRGGRTIRARRARRRRGSPCGRARGRSHRCRSPRGCPWR